VQTSSMYVYIYIYIFLLLHPANSEAAVSAAKSAQLDKDKKHTESIRCNSDSHRSYKTMKRKENTRTAARFKPSAPYLSVVGLLWTTTSQASSVLVLEYIMIERVCRTCFVEVGPPFSCYEF